MRPKWYFACVNDSNDWGGLECLWDLSEDWPDTRFWCLAKGIGVREGELLRASNTSSCFWKGQNESSTCPFPLRPFDMQLLAQSQHLDSLPVPVKKWSITPHQGTRYQPQFSLFPDPHQGRPRTSTFFLPLFQLSGLKCRGKAEQDGWIAAFIIILHTGTPNLMTIYTKKHLHMSQNQVSDHITWF